MIGIVGHETATVPAGRHEIDDACTALGGQYGKSDAAEIKNCESCKAAGNFLAGSAKKVTRRCLAAPVHERALARVIGVYNVKAGQAPRHALHHGAVDAFALPGLDHRPTEAIGT